MYSVNSQNRKAYQFQFEVILQSLVVEYTSAFNFKISMKRGAKILETKGTFKYELEGKKQVELNEQLNVISTLSVKKDVINEFQEKNYKFYLQVYTKQGFKNATFAETNFSNLLQLNHLNMSVK
jgi:N-acetylmuramoyl-L-alanine amidase CwlA